MKTMPRFTAEASLSGKSNLYHGVQSSGTPAMKGRVIPQEPPFLGCVRVSPYFCACGVHDEGSKTSHWVIVPC